MKKIKIEPTPELLKAGRDMLREYKPKKYMINCENVKCSYCPLNPGRIETGCLKYWDIVKEAPVALKEWIDEHKAD